ncbi:MAG: polymerase sigma factor, sigma-70 family, partial [Planctomycetaceae bacterium]|nr:polymerase sigma factor, sigma-70 family [Planctomycetaceae bacterium]
CGHGVRLGTIHKEFEIPADQSSVDLGVITGEWDQPLGTGKQAPLFVAEGIGGKNIQLWALRGKLVLIDFWATSCAPCIADFPELVKLHQQFARDSRFQLLGLALDESSDDAKKVIERHQLPWQMAMAGPGTHAFIPRRYEVQSIPQKFLIDIDGKILYRGNDLKIITEKIQTRLRELPDSVGNIADDVSGEVPLKSEDNFHSTEPAAVVLAIGNITYQPGAKPTLKGPGLKMWSADGKKTRSVDHVGTSGWITGPQRLALDLERERIYVCDTHHQHLLAFDRHGRQHFATGVLDLHAAAVDERSGDIWCLSVGQLNSGELLTFDSTGRAKDRWPIAAFGLAYSPVDNAFWIVGNSISKVTRTGKIVSSHPLPDGGYTFTDVVVDRQHGGAWVLEADHPDRPKSRYQLWRVQPDGKAAVTHTFPKTSMPRTLTSVDGQPWLAVMRNYKFGVPADKQNLSWDVQRFDLQGTPTSTLPLPAIDIAVGQKTGTIWVRTKDNIIQIDKQGATLLTIPCLAERQPVQLLAF